MAIIVYPTIKSYLADNNCNEKVVDAFENWRHAIENNDFANLSQLKKVFGAVDYVGNDRYIFNIMGNNYRLVVMIHFNVRTIYVLFVGTHKEYDKMDATTVTFEK